MLKWIPNEKCSDCSACTMVTRTISGYLLDESDMYYQCIGDAEPECIPQESINQPNPEYDEFLEGELNIMMLEDTGSSKLIQETLEEYEATSNYWRD